MRAWQAPTPRCVKFHTSHSKRICLGCLETSIPPLYNELGVPYVKLRQNALILQGGLFSLESSSTCKTIWTHRSMSYLLCQRTNKWFSPHSKWGAERN